MTRRRFRCARRRQRREELSATRAAYGPRHADHQRATLNYVKLLCSLGKPDVAEGVLREALGMLSATAGPRHVDTLRLAAQLALLLREMGRGAAAEPIYRRGAGRGGVHAPVCLCARGRLSLEPTLLQADGACVILCPRREVHTDLVATLGPGHKDTVAALISRVRGSLCPLSLCPHSRCARCRGTSADALVMVCLPLLQGKL